MKLDKDPFLASMNMIELKGKKVMVWPSQARSIEDDQAQKFGTGQCKNERSKPQSSLNANFNILMAKYRDGRAGIRGHENCTIQNTNLNNPVSLCQANTSVTGSSSNK
jgi:hypothetical protein